MLRQARRHQALPLILGDMRHLPVRDGAMDGLWASASFLHIPRRDGLAVLREFHRALRVGGVLYLAVKEGDGERWVETTEYGRNLRRFFVFYQAAELDDLVRAAGFTVQDGWISDGQPQRWLNRLAST
jgi:ubiquinone/menaquinone biosynthesis C-methylase UbiE